MVSSFMTLFVQAYRSDVADFMSRCKFAFVRCIMMISHLYMSPSVDLSGNFDLSRLEPRPKKFDRCNAYYLMTKM